MKKIEPQILADNADYFYFFFRAFSCSFVAEFFKLF